MESEPGKGTTFTVQIPVTKKSYTPHQLTESTPLVTSKPTTRNQFYSVAALLTDTNKPVVLVVEDNTDLRFFIGNLLNGHYEVHFANNGKEGVEKAIEVIPDLVLSDWMMPELTGKELCWRSRRVLWCWWKRC